MRRKAPLALDALQTLRTAVAAEFWRRGSEYAPCMKRLLVGVVGVYLLLAVITRSFEGKGALECGCSEDCWCKRPGLSTFRWVAPFGHRGYTPEQKHRLASRS